VNEEVAAALGETEATFRELGARIREITVPALDHVSEAFLVLCSTEAAAAHKETYPEYASEYGNELSELIEKGRKTTESRLAESLQERNRFADGLFEIFQEIDLLLTPTLSFPAPRLDFNRLQEHDYCSRRRPQQSRRSLFSHPSIYRTIQFQPESGD